MIGEIRVKNYRCFENSAPLRIQIRDDFSAYLGKNNSGKSALLKFFYEYRTIWRLFFESHHEVIELLRGNRTIPMNGVTDLSTVFCDSNTSDIEIEIGIPDFGDRSYRVIIHQYRKTGEFHIDLALGDNRIRISDPSHTNTIRYDWQKKTMAIDGFGEIEWAPIAAFFEGLHGMLYVGPFRNAISQSTETYFDLNIGTSFISAWSQWKTGDNKAQNIRIRDVTADIKRIFGFHEFDVSASPDNRQLHVNVDGKPYKLHELGSGISQFIVTFGNAAIRRPTFILIDEPELNLHPALQVDFLTALGGYSKRGVIFATHSIGLARSAAERIHTVDRIQGRSTVRPYEAHKNLVEFLGELGYTNMGDISSTHILLVEGVEDVKTIQQFLRKIGNESKVVLVPLGGSALISGSREQELFELTRISKKVGALIDSEKSSATTTLEKNRTEFEKVCKKVGINLHILERRAIENYFSDRAVKAAISPQHNALRPFELLREASPAWGKGENWKIAREMTPDEILSTDLGQFLSKLA